MSACTEIRNNKYRRITKACQTSTRRETQYVASHIPEAFVASQFPTCSVVTCSGCVAVYAASLQRCQLLFCRVSVGPLHRLSSQYDE